MIAASFEESRAEAIVVPEFGRRVVFAVEWRQVNVGSRWRNFQWRYVVALRGSDGQGFSHHMSFEQACSRMLSRARRYERAYSKPRGIDARKAAAS